MQQPDTLFTWLSSSDSILRSFLATIFIIFVAEPPILPFQLGQSPHVDFLKPEYGARGPRKNKSRPKRTVPSVLGTPDLQQPRSKSGFCLTTRSLPGPKVGSCLMLSTASLLDLPRDCWRPFCRGWAQSWATSKESVSALPFSLPSPLSSLLPPSSIPSHPRQNLSDSHINPSKHHPHAHTLPLSSKPQRWPPPRPKSLATSPTLSSPTTTTTLSKSRSPLSSPTNGVSQCSSLLLLASAEQSCCSQWLLSRSATQTSARLRRPLLCGSSSVSYTKMPYSLPWQCAFAHFSIELPPRCLPHILRSDS